MAQPSGYHVINKIDVGGEGGWDFLAMNCESHGDSMCLSDKVVVIDVESEKVPGEIANANGVDGLRAGAKRLAFSKTLLVK